MTVPAMRLRYALDVAALRTIDEARALGLARAHPLAAELVAVAAAAGRVSALATTALVDLPPFASSAMDGFAIRAADAPGQLTVVDHAAAGSPAGLELGAGEAIEIST